MLPVSITTIRLYLHVLAATVWVGGQITLAGLVPGLRSLSPEAPRVVARAIQPNRMAGVRGAWCDWTLEPHCSSPPRSVERVSRHVVRGAGCGRGVGGQCSSPCRSAHSRRVGCLGSRERRQRVGCTFPWSAAQRLIFADSKPALHGSSGPRKATTTRSTRQRYCRGAPRRAPAESRTFRTSPCAPHLGTHVLVSRGDWSRSRSRNLEDSPACCEVAFYSKLKTGSDRFRNLVRDRSSPLRLRGDVTVDRACDPSC